MTNSELFPRRWKFIGNIGNIGNKTDKSMFAAVCARFGKGNIVTCYGNGVANPNAE
jgi:hypothetical protein